MRTCDVEGCEKKHMARGKCSTHYVRPLTSHERSEAERYFAMGLNFREIGKLLDKDRQTISENFPDARPPGIPRRSAERYDQLRPLVQAGVSLNEIRRTTGMDYRTVRRYFPNYRPFKPGGGNEIREVNRKLREIDGTGKVQRNRDSGFTQRKDLA